MPQFVLIFRPTRPTSAADLPTRNAIARDWVLARRDEATLRAAFPLEPGGAIVSQAGSRAAVPEGAVASIVVLEAADLRAAVAIAGSYPNLAVGSEIEIRSVRSTAPQL